MLKKRNNYATFRRQIVWQNYMKWTTR